jgi:glutamate synthase domain-containing protein 2
VAACAESMVAARSAKAEAGAVWQLVSSRFGVKQRGEKNGGGSEEGGGV